MWTYILAWFPMVIIGIVNGLFREKVLALKFNELKAHQLSTLTGLLLFALYIGIIMRIWRPETVAKAITIGIVWLAMTVVFEFIFGHYVAGHSWQRLLQDYNLAAGRLWILVLIWVAVAPYVFYRIWG